MSSNNVDEAALAQLARHLGLEKLYEAQPELVRQAYDGGRAMARRLQRPDDIADEPAHVFRADNNV